MREVQLQSVLEFKEMHGITYVQETSAKSGKNVERLFSDCARFIYDRYKDKMDNVGNDGDLSSDDVDNSYEDNQGGSFKQSNGHKAGRLNRRNMRNKKRKKQNLMNKCQKC
tara:strand:- start:81 stop:413 length:333 start_codon:yes stop_codon:yes gene_type:complete